MYLLNPFLGTYPATLQVISVQRTLLEETLPKGPTPCTMNSSASRMPKDARMANGPSTLRYMNAFVIALTSKKRVHRDIKYHFYK